MSFVSAKKRLTLGDAINAVMLCIIMALCLFPFLYVISVSFTDPDAYVPMKLILVPEKLSLEAYQYILTSNNFMTATRNTVGITMLGTVMNLFVTFTFAYGLTKADIPGTRFLNHLVVFTLIFNAGIVPNYLLVKSLGLINSQWALILSSLTSAWDVVVVRSFMHSLPREIEESACIDGCNELTCFYRIILPLSKASLATFTLFFAVMYWNMYFKAMVYLSDSSKWTLQVLLKTMIIDSDSIGFSPTADQNMLPQETIKMAAIVTSMIPVLIVYPFLQKHFAKGVMVGSVKG